MTTRHYILALALVLPQFSAAAVYKCSMPEGNVLFQEECPKNALSAQKQNIRKPSNLGFRQQTSQPLTAGSEIIANGDFERTIEGWEIIQGTAQALPKLGISGSTGLLLSGENSQVQTHLVRQCLPINGITEVNIRAFVNQEGTNTRSSELRVVSFTSEDCTTGGKYSAKLNPSLALGWQTLQANGLKPVLGAKSIMVEIAYIAPDAEAETSRVIWDDIEFTAVTVGNQLIGQGAYSKFTQPLGANYVTNASFDRDLDNWRQTWPAQWVEYGGKGLSGGVLVTASSDFGQKIQGKALSQCINIGNHTQFEASAAFKKDSLSSQKGQGELRITWHQLTDCKGLQIQAGESQSQDGEQWQKLATSIENTSGAQSVTLSLIQTIYGAGTYSVFWDDIALKAVQ